ncbi:hypothetical protein LSTR_LSTR011039 [Laodelphax striatellus]|uniref:GOST seven transmembrane domain-containing protein n=1 Tax=Laodelphax striatellus TaxID=195883 RepID=A0A482WH18_LAOST|nr:hypothetical protein LSTR_LSTR011039 [Laodelphax striatellus]
MKDNVIKNNDHRRFIPLSTFGFYVGGSLSINLKDFHVEPWDDSNLFGFSLDRTLNDAMSPYLDTHQERCLLEQAIQTSNVAFTYFVLDFKHNMLKINCSSELKHLQITNRTDSVLRRKRDDATNKFSDANLLGFSKKRSPDSMPVDPDATADVVNNVDFVQSSPCINSQFPLKVEKRDNKYYYSSDFTIRIVTPNEEGLYNLYFHNCRNYKSEKSLVSVDFSVHITEVNRGDNYLSAGEMPLPTLYFMTSLLFCMSGIFWVVILKKSKHPVFKIHYLMAVLVFLKSLSLLFHAINYHFIETKGEHVATWAILYYITHLLKGSVLFITIVLIGTGWTFIKHLLSEKDKKIFMIVIPLQVLANVANIIIEESEEGDIEHKTWIDVLMLVDLLCCGAILFPVVWSIRHLQEASHTDGKAAVSLRKLKLFRHFYIMIVCYIYFTRIIIYLLQLTVSFQYEWLDEMFREMVTYIFFVMTGYKFRPASANPYFQVNSEDEDEELDVVLSQCGVTEGLSKLSRIASEAVEEERENLLVTKRESSHEYD